MAKKRRKTRPIPKRSPYELSAVMRAIFSRGDVPHKTLVLLRKRAVEVAQGAKLEPGHIAFTMLALLEHNWQAEMIIALDDSSLVRWTQRVRFPND
jgi:hypothetical protein